MEIYFVLFSQGHSSLLFGSNQVFEGLEISKLRSTRSLMIVILSNNLSVFLIISEMPFTIVCTISGGRAISSSRC
jgi:hypothetical protein